MTVADWFSTASNAIAAFLLNCFTSLRPNGYGMNKQIFHVGLQSRGTLALPAELRKRHHLDEPGTQVRLVEREDGVIELHPLVAVPADQFWFWAERWQQLEREADEDIAAGRTSRHESVDDMIADLDR